MMCTQSQRHVTMCTVWCIDVLAVLSSSIILVDLAQPKIILCCWLCYEWSMEHTSSVSIVAVVF